MKHFSKTNYKTDVDPASNYTLKDSLLHNSLQSKKAQYSSRLISDTSSNNYNTTNSRGKSYETLKRNQDYLNTETSRKQMENSIPNTTLNHYSMAKMSPICNTTSVDFKKYNDNIAFDNPVTRPPSLTEYSKQARSKDEKVVKSNKILSNFLPERARDKSNKKTLILDLDETLVHSAFNQFYMKSDIILNIELDRKKSVVHVLKRPGVDEFLQIMARHYEVVIFTASVSAYANPLINQLDTKKSVVHRLFREHCTLVNGNFVKDMRKLGRNLKDVIILDNNPASFAFNKDNGVPIKTWLNDKRDKELFNMTTILEFLAYVDDVRDYIKKFVSANEVNYNTANSIMKNFNLGKVSEVDDYSSRGRSPLNSGNVDSKKNININIINNNYSNIYLGENYNLDRMANKPKLLEEKKSKDSSTNKYNTSSNLFRNSYNNLKENNTVKVSTSKYTPTYLNSNISSPQRDQSKEKPTSSDLNNQNTYYNSYFDKSLVSKKFEQLTPSRSNTLVTNNTKSNYSDFNERYSLPYSFSLNKNPAVTSLSNYYSSTLNNRADKISNQIKNIDNDIIVRNTDSYRSLISKSLDRPKTSDIKLKNLRNDEIILSHSSTIKNLTPYNANRLNAPSDKAMSYTSSFFNKHDNANSLRSVERKEMKSPNPAYESKYNTFKYDDIKQDNFYSPKAYTNYTNYNESKLYGSNDTIKPQSRDNNLYQSDKDSFKYNNYTSYNNSTNNFYSQTVRDRLNIFSLNKF